MVDRTKRPDRMFDMSVPEPIVRLGIAVQTLLFGVVGVLSTLTDQGPSGVVGTTIVLVVCATTVPAAIAISRTRLSPNWWMRSSRSNTVFVFYAELGVTTVVFTFADIEMAIVGATLLALVGSAAAHFCPPKMLWFHVVWSVATVGTLVARALIDGVEDPTALILRAAVVGLVINGAVFLLSDFSAAIVAASRQHLSNAITDPLTGLLNRRGIESHAATAARRGTAPASLVLLDVDDFKNVNDTHGHAAGDAVLRLAAIRLAAFSGPDAVVSRFGGEEFVVLVTDPQPNLVSFAELLRLSLTNPDDEIPITASAGASPPADTDAEGSTFAATMASADAAMYRAKSYGRDRTELA